MKLTISKWSGGALCCAISLVLLGTLLYASSRETSDVPLNEKAKVTGVILSRAGDMVRIKNKKSGHLVVVNITDSTKIERKRGHLAVSRQLGERMERKDGSFAGASVALTERCGSETRSSEQLKNIRQKARNCTRQ